MQRQAGKIARAIIVETKGGLYGNDQKFIKRREFMESTFLKLNPHFDYLYLEDSLPAYARRQKTYNKIRTFFQEAD